MPSDAEAEATEEPHVADSDGGREARGDGGGPDLRPALKDVTMALSLEAPRPQPMTTAPNGHPAAACTTSEPGPATRPSCQNAGWSAGNGEPEPHEPKASPARLLRFFSASRKRAPSAERAHGLAGSSSGCSALASFCKMGSFKKLKSSVLQCIQSREAGAKDQPPERSARRPVLNGAGPGPPGSRLPCLGRTGAPLEPGVGGASDCSDLEEADEAFPRSGHRSRSLRRAYALGRISLLEPRPLSSCVPEPREPLSSCVPEPHEPREPHVRAPDPDHLVHRRSKSPDSLTFLQRSSFKRKSACSLAELRAPDAPPRTLSSASAEEPPRGGARRTKRWRSPIRAKDFDRVRKLVGNVTEAAWKREGAQSGAASPGGRSPRPRPRSRLHDDSSRRAASGAEPGPRPRAPAGPAARLEPRVDLDTAAGPAARPEPRVDLDTAVCPLEAGATPTPDSAHVCPAGPSPRPSARDPAGPAPPGPLTSEPERPPTPLRPTTPKRLGAASVHLACPNHHSVLFLSSVDSEERAEGPAPQEQAPGVSPDGVQTPSGDDGNEDSGISSYSQLSLSGAAGPEDRKEEPATRPPVPAHQVPPYKAVSARFRPLTFSQSTPIGLDRVGRRRQMGASNISTDGGTESSALVDDNVSEEDYSYEDLCQASPRYLQPGGEQLAINEGNCVFHFSLSVMEMWCVQKPCGTM
ncbi:uncharacterized protein ACDL77_017486 [Rhynchocyon petersi]